MFRLCFGGGQAADSGKGLVLENRYDRAQPHVVPSEPDNVHPKAAKKEVPAEAPAPATKTFTSTFVSENTTGTSLSCEASSAYQVSTGTAKWGDYARRSYQGMPVLPLLIARTHAYIGKRGMPAARWA